jgi:Raf kinase inhibitor-like YbhB/YbcL family protein
MLELTVMSAAFVMGAAIPPKYTCMGEDVSPPLSWSKLPEGAQSVAVLCDDPDAPGGDWVHWVLFNLPPGTAKLDEGVPATPSLPNGAVQGVNDFRRAGYGGPCPPPGRPHRYRFKVFALDTKLALRPSAQKRDVVKAMEGHVLARGELMGRFGR